MADEPQSDCAQVEVSERASGWVVQLVNGEHVATIATERVKYRAVNYARAAALVRDVPLIVDGVRTAP
jgi:hypothetical protein